MFLRFEELQPKKLIGKSLTMTFAANQTAKLWQSFMPMRHQITNTTGDHLFSLQHYPPDFFAPFNPYTPFTKWAAAEVKDFSSVPEGLETFDLQGGLYALFFYKGDAKNAASFFQQIYGEWLPSSGYALDDRPHFELLGQYYKNGDPGSEEEIWIPLKPKG
jgi:AraC family transcriptional regulator